MFGELLEACTYLARTRALGCNYVRCVVPSSIGLVRASYGARSIVGRHRSSRLRDGIHSGRALLTGTRGYRSAKQERLASRPRATRMRSVRHYSLSALAHPARVTFQTQLP